MVRGPICGGTNAPCIGTRGPTGQNDAGDPNNPVIQLINRIPLSFAPKKPSAAQPQSTKNRKRLKVNAVIKLKNPSVTQVSQLNKDIQAVLKLDKEYQASKKAKDEKLRLAKEKVVHDIVKAYGIGIKYVTGLEHDNRDPTLLAGTKHTFIVTHDGILVHPGFVASVIIHESSHAQRNAELEKAGLDREKFGKFGIWSLENEIWKALIEIEGYQLEIDNAAKTGITMVELKDAHKLLNNHLLLLEGLTNRKVRQRVEKGDLDSVRAQFIRNKGKLK